MEVLKMKGEPFSDEEQDALLDINLVKNEGESLKLTCTTGKADSLAESSSHTILKFDVAKEEKEENCDEETEKMENILVRVKTEQPGDVLQDEIISKFSDSNDDDVDSVMNVKTETEFQKDLQKTELGSEITCVIDPCARMNDHIERQGTRKCQINKGLRRSYDANLKIMVVHEAEKTNNCTAARKFGVTENNVRRWRKQKTQLLNAHSTRKAFRGPKNGRYEELDECVVQYVKGMRDKGFPITREVIQFKGKEIAKSLNISETEFKASLGWCKRMMKRNGLALR
ncbi:uncharacterized protein LOC106471975 isoform X2 [Limulus polyphemus]|uniref:Uncharacterized protein LOC106471975 isoform X2 n=1 Tax=Limulus polyphemus TaxID=6850 RepID=A0ABM1BSY5_LIMPO|nr:uncharacterized protein LOC106471975 isoform X2 [Limulus polyphemus]